ncbi:MAG TPA: hypothetical protein VFX33_06070 [Actinomycetales bacterium]|nr:hypothetical protein [Actinomycetales bacterium]
MRVRVLDAGRAGDPGRFPALFGRVSLMFALQVLPLRPDIADATSWFLVVLAARGDRGLADELKQAWRGADAWLEGALDQGAGLIRSGPRTRPGG